MYKQEKENKQKRIEAVSTQTRVDHFQTMYESSEHRSQIARE